MVDFRVRWAVGLSLGSDDFAASEAVGRGNELQLGQEAAGRLDASIESVMGADSGFCLGADRYLKSHRQAAG